MELVTRFLIFIVLMKNVSGDTPIRLLTDEYFEWRMSDKPEIATYSNNNKYNDILESFLETDFHNRKVKAETFLANLHNISREDLSRMDKLNYDILENMLTSYLDGYQWRFYNSVNPLNFLEGPQVVASTFIDVPLFTLGDYENYLARLNRLPTQLDERMDLFRIAMNKGTTYHNVSVFPVLDQISKICPNSNNYSIDCTYYKPFLEPLDKITLTVTSRENIRSRGRTAITQLVSKYQELSTFLQTEYIPATRSYYGILNVVNGTEYYKACLKWHLSFDKTPEEVHQVGVQEVARIEGEMKKIMANQDFHGTVSEYFGMIQNDSSKFFDTGDEVLEQFRRDNDERIDPILPKLFKNLPQLPLKIRATTFDGIGGYYIPGSADGSRPGIFYANVMRPGAFPKMSMLPLLIHEGSPGHHLQLSYSLLTSAPNFRSKMEYTDVFHVPYSFPSYTAFVEGWALYAEYLGEELNLYKDDDELMGRYSSEMFRACRLVIDTGIHYYNWTRQGAIDYMAKYTAESYDDIVIEIDRYITWPGQACAYKIGELKIKELRAEAEETLGDKFDVRDFHTSIMEAGSVPLNVFERNVREWIEEKLAESPTSTELPPICSANNILFHTWIIFSTLMFNSIVLSWLF